MSDESAVDAPVRREVRLGLVMNGGVSLAVWIGGFTHEIDALRRARDADPELRTGGRTTAQYAKLLAALQQRVVVDVISGASAGGINGALLGAAIAYGRPLPSLRDTWLELGDFRRLLRAPGEAHPPSLLYGDTFALPELRRQIVELHAQRRQGPDDTRLYCYLTATDVYGQPVSYSDSTGRSFVERDHRVSFRFVNGPDAPPVFPAASDTEVSMPPMVNFADPRAPELLARASRATLSFPGAFEAHELSFDGDNAAAAHRRWLIDGGVLDNQPFGPVLNQIALMPASTPVRRVVAYVVPYVTEPSYRPGAALATYAEDEDPPSMLDTISASSKLPRDLPKLDSLERVRRDERAARETRLARLWFHQSFANADPVPVAASLLRTYRGTRRRAVFSTILTWGRVSFVPGMAPGGFDETVQGSPTKVATKELLQPEIDHPWVPPADLPIDEWVGPRWRWGISPAERIASDALAFLHDVAREQLTAGGDSTDVVRDARDIASRMVLALRADQRHFAELVSERAGSEAGLSDEQLIAAAVEIYDEQRYAETSAAWIAELDRALGRVAGVPRVRELLAAEVIRNAAEVETPAAQPPFVFLFASAGVRNSLGHPLDSPEQKLAGMKLGHFAGFLKRSWRANDWLWGRLDGVEHLLRAVVDVDYVAGLPGSVAADLSEHAFPAGGTGALTEAWQATLNWLDLHAPQGSTAGAQFAAAVDFVRDGSNERQERERWLRACRAALAAPIQLSILEEELAEVAKAAAEDGLDGASPTASGLRWARSWDRSVPVPDTDALNLFRTLRVAEEDPADELWTRLGLQLTTQGSAVAVAALAGERGGLPVVARGLVALLRGTTNLVAGLVRLVATFPTFGLALLIALSGLAFWGLVSPNVLLGALLPMAVLGVVALATALVTIATSALEPPVHGRRGAALLALLAALPLAAAAWLWHVPWLDVGILGSNRLERHAADALRFPEEHMGHAPSVIAAGLLFAAFLVMVVRGALGGRLMRLKPYRWLVVLALIVAGAGVAYVTAFRDATCDGGTGWACVADERRGTILVALLLLVSAVATILVEFAADLKRWWRGRGDFA